MVVLNSRGGYLSDGFKIEDVTGTTILILDIEILVLHLVQLLFSGKYRTMEKCNFEVLPYVYKQKTIGANQELEQII